MPAGLPAARRAGQAAALSQSRKCERERQKEAAQSWLYGQLCRACSILTTMHLSILHNRTTNLSGLVLGLSKPLYGRKYSLLASRSDPPIRSLRSALGYPRRKPSRNLEVVEDVRHLVVPDVASERKTYAISSAAPAAGSQPAFF